jgi:biopolymer transport protein ExbD
MIDVMMFLLVFFVLISINVLPALGLKTHLPASAQPQDIQAPVRVIVTLGANGELMADGQAASLAELSVLIHQREQPGRKTAVVINGDRTVELQRLVDVLDALKTGGFESVAIATSRK